MRLFLDENVPLSAVAALKSIGFVVEHAKEAGLRGANDRKITKYAKRQNAILITKDIEFGSVIVYPKGSHYGLVILRLPSYFNAQSITKTLKDFFLNITADELVGKVIILELGRYRMRDLK